jgi:hypothetical protein
VSPRPSLKDRCPRVADHSPEPRGYLQWHEWAREKSKTHRQVKCKGCGLFAIWAPK